MQNNPNRDMLVGGLVVLLVAGLFGFSYSGKQMSAEASVGTYPVMAVFSRVDGLFEGDEVRLGGIRIGTVGSQSLDHNFRAVVTLQIDDGLEIPVDTAAAIHTDGLFGSKFVVLEPGGEEDDHSSGWRDHLHARCRRGGGAIGLDHRRRQSTPRQSQQHQTRG